MATTLANISIKDSSSWNTYLNLIYPIGSVYISYIDISPATRFGGTWSAITGRFPYFDANISTGGSNTQTLTVDNLPPHSHNIGDNPILYKGAWNGNFGGANGNDLQSANSSYSTHNTGLGTAHNNMPAYQTLYAWRRTT